jgi:hypothetical protein
MNTSTASVSVDSKENLGCTKIVQLACLLAVGVWTLDRNFEIDDRYI